MAERRKAALVVDHGKLVGIFGFKDMMTRVVAKELPLELTATSKVMTPNPEAVSPDMTVLDALQTMHDNKFLTLPVCEDDGTVVGLVDVMDVIYGCGGVEGWRSIFSSSLELDDLSDTGSMHSGRESTARSARSKKVESGRPSDSRSVSMLRPKKPLISADNESILAVTKMLTVNRGDAAVIVDGNGGLVGIVTDTDVTRRVVAKHVDPSSVAISDVMTPNPKCVVISDSAMDAMMLMVENHFRHLPVSDEKGAIVGVLDIAKCLNDAISKLEKSQSKGNDAADNLLQQALQQQGGQGAVALQALLGPLVSQAFGDKSSRTLGSILVGKPMNIVTPETRVITAAMLMADSRKSALVVENGELVGIFGFKDMMTRVISQELDVGSTEIADVMTPDPETVPPEMTVLEALQTMHDHRILALPVCKEDGSVLGIVDVMDVIDACGGADGWRAVFESALDIDDDMSYTGPAATPSVKPRISVPVPSSSPAAIPVVKKDPVITVSRDAPFVTSPLPNNIPMTLEFEEGQFEEGQFDESGISLNDTFRMESKGDASYISEAHTMTWKVVDPSGHTHRFRAEARLERLHAAFGEKAKLGKKKILFKFVDDEGDAIVITSDEDLAEATNLSRLSGHRSGNQTVKLTAEEIEDSSGLDTMVLAGIGAAVAVIGIAAMLLLRPSKK
jgi:CBS domain-containing protein